MFSKALWSLPVFGLVAFFCNNGPNNGYITELAYINVSYKSSLFFVFPPDDIKAGKIWWVETNESLLILFLSSIFILTFYDSFKWQGDLLGAIWLDLEQPISLD